MTAAMAARADQNDKPANGVEEASDDGLLDQQLSGDLGAGEDIEGADQVDPLTRIGRRMKIAQQRMTRKKTSAATQQVQKQIVDDLAALIDRVSKSKAASGGQRNSPRSTTSGQKIKQPGKQPGANADKPDQKQGPEKSTDRVGESDPAQVKVGERRALVKQAWGHLPEKLRSQMPDAWDEEFLPKYVELIENYFQRLAEEGHDRP